MWLQYALENYVLKKSRKRYYCSYTEQKKNNKCEKHKFEDEEVVYYGNTKGNLQAL